MRQKLSIVTLGVRDLAMARRFYQEGITFFDLGGVGLALFPFEELAKDATVSPEREGFPGITLAYNTKNAEEVDEVLVLAEKAGAKIVKPAQKVFWGGYSGYFSDLDGYLWEVAWNPFIDMDDNGALVFP